VEFQRSQPVERAASDGHDDGGVLMASGDQERDEALDGWRGIACLLVYFVHKGLTLDAPPLVIPGFTGVHMFFVLSGYLFSGPFLRVIHQG
jgi:peptidoglycan/LPS O-acetylase OafA/YrhL